MRVVVLLAALACAGCRSAAPPPAAGAMPADAIAAVAIDLATLRAAPAYPHLPAALRALADPLAGESQLLLAWNGTDLLLVASGAGAQPPSGYTGIGKGIAAAGSAERIEAARRALTAGAKPPLNLPVANAELRAALRADGRLPLFGNLADAGNLLRMADSTTVTAHLETSIEVEAAAQCASIGKAAELEQSLRAMQTLAAAGTRDPDLAALLRSIRVQRESLIVRVHAIAKPEAFAKVY